MFTVRYAALLVSLATLSAAGVQAGPNLTTVVSQPSSEWLRVADTAMFALTMEASAAAAAINVYTCQLLGLYIYLK